MKRIQEEDPQQRDQDKNHFLVILCPLLILLQNCVATLKRYGYLHIGLKTQKYSLFYSDLTLYKVIILWHHSSLLTELWEYLVPRNYWAIWTKTFQEWYCVILQISCCHIQLFSWFYMYFFFLEYVLTFYFWNNWMTVSHINHYVYHIVTLLLFRMDHFSLSM